jgi:hypothetical protein
MKRPFVRRASTWDPTEVEDLVVGGRLDGVREMGPEKLREVIAYHLTQITVRKAAKIRLRYLEKQKGVSV